MMKSVFFVMAVLFVAVSISASGYGWEPKETKLHGSPLGYRSLHHPLKAWNAHAPAERWAGELSEAIGWDQVKRIRVVHQRLHIRDNEQIESLVRSSLSDSSFIEALPGDARINVGEFASLLQLQVLLELNSGESALMSIGGTGNAAL